jgi:hypothetical protein
MNKTYIVYSLDTLEPVAVGEQINAECARVTASELTGLRYCNLIAEEVNESKMVSDSNNG